MNDVYFRTGPSTSAGSHMMLKKSAAVTVMGENGNFYKVTYGGKNGYVMKTYISFTKPASSEDGTWATPRPATSR